MGYLIARKISVFDKLAITIFVISLILYSIAILIRILVKNAIDKIMYDDINFEKYIKCLTYIRNNSESKKLRRINTMNLVYAEAEVLFYKGEYEKALKKIKELDEQLLSKTLRDKYHYLYFNINLFLENIEELKKSINYFESIQQRSNNKNYLLKIQNLVSDTKAMTDIVIGKRSNNNCTFSKENSKRHKLSHIYLDLYFNALNSKLLGDFNHAEELFLELSKENEELFFVKEAKKEIGLFNKKQKEE